LDLEASKKKVKALTEPRNAVLVGANDTPFLKAADYMAAKIPNSRKVVIPDAGHAANIDQPQAFNTALADFLTSLPNDA